MKRMYISRFVCDVDGRIDIHAPVVFATSDQEAKEKSWAFLLEKFYDNRPNIPLRHLVTEVMPDSMIIEAYNNLQLVHR